MEVDVPDDVSELSDEAASDSPERRNASRSSLNWIDNGLRPIWDVREMFEDMVNNLKPTKLAERPIKLNIATLCSGTDAPIFALDMLQDAMQVLGFGTPFDFKHLLSCEIEPFKQGFIRRNLAPDTLIFRDVVELAMASPKGKA